MVKAPLITILTPTFNRAVLLRRLFESLQNQTSLNFEWLIVDDGSRDGTEDVVAEFVSEAHYSVRYLYKENGGKHSALNVGFRGALGEWVLMVDSDDWLVPECVARLEKEIRCLDESIGSICFLKAYSTGAVVGDEFPSGLQNYQDRMLAGVKGDKADVFRRESLRDFAFPVHPGEKFMAESYLFVWFSVRSKTRFINYAGYICEYQAGGLSAESIANRHRSFRSTLYTYGYQYRNIDNAIFRAKAAINWWRFRIGKKYECEWAPPLCFAPIGLALYLKDRFG